MEDKPVVDLSNVDGNVFAIIGHVSKALPKDRAKEWRERAMNCESYDKVLQLMFEYVDPE